MLTSTRRLRVSGFFVALTQRTHSHRAIGVVSFHRSWIFCGAAARAAARSGGTLGSGQSLVTSMSSVASSPALMPAACCSVSSTLIQWPAFPSGSSTVWNPAPLIIPWTATCPREGRFLLASAATATQSMCRLWSAWRRSEWSLPLCAESPPPLIFAVPDMAPRRRHRHRVRHGSLYGESSLARGRRRARWLRPADLLRIRRAGRLNTARALTKSERPEPRPVR